jgi:hypothetical protein
MMTLNILTITVQNVMATLRLGLADFHYLVDVDVGTGEDNSNCTIR